MSKFDLDVLHQTISDTQSNICQAVIVKEGDSGNVIYIDAKDEIVVAIRGIKVLVKKLD